MLTEQSNGMVKYLISTWASENISVLHPDLTP